MSSSAFVGGCGAVGWATAGARVCRGGGKGGGSVPRRLGAARVAATAGAVPQGAGLAQRQAAPAPFRGRTGLILVNIGTPKSLAVRDVRAYLREFLGDRRVVDINPVLKFVLLNLVVLPFRPKESAEAYAAIWDDDRGSPLIFHTEDLVDKLQARLGGSFDIQIGNQFGQPSVNSAMQHMRDSGVDRIIVLPLFPQYASSTTGSAAEIVYREAAKLYCTPYLHIVPAFYDHSGYVDAYAEIIKARVGEKCQNFDMLLMSFHGVPQTHCTRTDDTEMHCLKSDNCCDAIIQANRNCYRAQCFESARKIAAAAGIPDNKYMVAFQSRLSAAGPVWIQPYTDETIAELGKNGVKKLACVVPSFAVDCLETLEEIGIRGKEDFLDNGGEEFELISCLNASDKWADGLVDILKDCAPVVQ